jgi:hypothetical protein
MPNSIFEIIADGKKVGIVVAATAEAAMHAAIGATTRRTHSKMGESGDYDNLVLCELRHDRPGSRRLNPRTVSLSTIVTTTLPSSGRPAAWHKHQVLTSERLISFAESVNPFVHTYV